MLPYRDIPGHGKHQRGLTHSRTGCYQYQVTFLEAGRLVIQIDKARRQPGHITGGTRRQVDLFQRFHYDITDGFDFTHLTFLYHFKDLLLGIGQQVAQIPFEFVAILGHPFRYTDQVTQYRLLCHIGSIILGIDGGRHRKDHIPQKLRCHHFGRHIHFFQALLQGQRIDRHPFGMQIEHRLVDRTISFVIENLPVRQNICNRRDQGIVNIETAQYRLFRLHTVRFFPVLRTLYICIKIRHFLFLCHHCSRSHTRLMRTDPGRNLYSSVTTTFSSPVTCGCSLIGTG